MCWRPRESSREDPVAYLVRSLRTCARIRSLTTGTFNLVVKDRISTPPERREFSPAKLVCVGPGQAKARRYTQTLFSRPRNPTNIPCGKKPCQSAHPTEFPRDFHNGNGGLGELNPSSNPGCHSEPGRRPDEKPAFSTKRGRAALQSRVKLPPDDSPGELNSARNGMAFRPLDRTKPRIKRLTPKAFQAMRGP
jgi:hypothetical protein